MMNFCGRSFFCSVTSSSLLYLGDDRLHKTFGDGSSFEVCKKAGLKNANVPTAGLFDDALMQTVFMTIFAFYRAFKMRFPPSCWRIRKCDQLCNEICPPDYLKSSLRKQNMFTFYS